MKTYREPMGPSDDYFNEDYGKNRERPDFTRIDMAHYPRIEQFNYFKQSGLSFSTTVNINITLRFAGEQDVPLILDFIKALADYEHMLDQVTATEGLLRKSLFVDKRAETIICQYKGVDAGFVLFFHNYSTFLGKSGIYIEDLFVKPEFRGKGLGKTMLKYLARLCLERGGGRLEWWCLDWNKPSIEFYKSQGATPMSDWTTYRVDGERLQKLAGMDRGSVSRSVSSIM
jgi:GNAT superfamily N-acetyltransferase